METNQLLMTQKERDRLAKKKLITQKQAAEEIGVSERQVRRMLRSLRGRGDQAVIHAERGRASNWRIATKTYQKAIDILSQEVYRDFGPTLATEYLSKTHKLQAGRETLRGWMIEAKLWRAKAKRVEKVHTCHENGGDLDRDPANYPDDDQDGSSLANLGLLSALSHPSS